MMSLSAIYLLPSETSSPYYPFASQKSIISRLLESILYVQFPVWSLPSILFYILLLLSGYQVKINTKSSRLKLLVTMNKNIFLTSWLILIHSNLF